jgi:hypothetical protein
MEQGPDTSTGGMSPLSRQEVHIRDEVCLSIPFTGFDPKDLPSCLLSWKWWNNVMTGAGDAPWPSALCCLWLHARS